MDNVLCLLILTLVHVLFTTADISFTCDPDVYPASHLGDFIVTCNAILDRPIDSIEYRYNDSVIWTYNVEPYPVSNPLYLVVDADPPAVNSSSHQFTIIINRCAGDKNREVVLYAVLLSVDGFDYSQSAILPIEKVPGTLSMTVDDDVVSCDDDVIVKNGSPTIGCTIREAYPEPTLTLLHDGQGMIQTDGPMLNNGKCLYYLTTTSVTHITNRHKHNITCMSGNETCSIILEKECDLDFYGVNCTKVCSSHCGACHHMIGCSGGCTDGYTGEFCTTAPEGNIKSSGSPAWMIVAIILMVVGIFAAAATVLWIYYYKKKLQASTTPVDPKITGKDIVKTNEVYTYIEVDRTRNVAYTIPTDDIREVRKTSTITKVKSDYKAEDNNNGKQLSAAATCDQNIPQPYENVEFDGSNNENETYMTPISESTTD